jgi:hypothetical protein
MVSGTAPGDPRLVVVCGLPGAGKTTVGEAVADRIDAEVVRTDVVRKRMVEEPDYTDEETARVYRRLVERARSTLAEGGNVVLDGTFVRRAFRDLAADAATEAGAAFDLVRVRCDESVVEERIRRREDGVSDADFEVYRIHEEAFEPVEREHVAVDNSGDLERTREQVRERI